jgi:hypothetical protein
MCVTQITPLIVQDGKRYGFHLGQREGRKLRIDQTSISTGSDQKLILDQTIF